MIAAGGGFGEAIGPQFDPLGKGFICGYESGRIAANLISRRYGVEFVSKNTEV